MKLYVVSTFVAWRLLLNAIAWWASNNIYLKRDFFGHIPWANFDGSHYLTIAKQGYLPYQQAFFPFFSMLIHVMIPFFDYNAFTASLFLVHLAFIISLFIFWKLIQIDFKNSVAMWAIIFLLFFPTSFFFGSIYTESLSLMLILGSFYAARKNHWFIASLLGGFASATRFIGIFLLPALLWEFWEQHKFKIKTKSFLWLLLIPTGLIGYMIYLQITVGDALAFIHVQPAFGANRTGGAIVLLPQVLFRYLKIMITIPWIDYDLRIAVLELFMFSYVMGLLVFSWRKIRKSYLIFAILATIAPTLTGSLSSMPRYVLLAFPAFIALATIENTMLKILLMISFISLLSILTMLFAQGYWVA